MSDVTFLAVEPALGTIDVSVDTDFAFTAFAPSGILLSTLNISIDGNTAYNNGFIRPGYSGTLITPSSQYLTARFNARRSFLYNVKPQVIVQLGSSSFPSPISFTYNITTQLPPGTLLDATLRSTAVDISQTTYPAIEAYRQGILSAVKGVSATSSLVVLYYRALTSTLRGLLYQAPFAAPAANEVSLLRSVDLGSMDSISATVLNMLPLWEAALKELLALGVDQQTISLIFQAGSSPNPPDQAAAACMLVLLATQYFLNAGLVVV